jgi:hypothetical protein
MNDAALLSQFDALGYEEAVDVVANALSENDQFLDAVRTMGGSGVSGLGQTDAVTAAAMRLLEPLMPSLGAKLHEVAGPATEKAMAVAIPKLRAQIPLFAAITGLVAGALVLGGMYLAKKI